MPLFVAAVLVFFSPNPAVTGEVVSNAGFEEDTDPWDGYPDSWTDAQCIAPGRATGRYTVDRLGDLLPDAPFEGRHSVGRAAFGLLSDSYLYQPVTVATGTLYALEVYYAQDMVPREGCRPLSEVRIGWNDDLPTCQGILSYGACIARATSPLMQWEVLSAEFVAQAGVLHLCLVNGWSGNESVVRTASGWDGLCLIPLESAAVLEWEVY